MGILSEIDMMNRDAEDDAFEVSSDSETVDSFSEEFEPVEPQKPEPQAEEAEEARKKAEFDAAEAKRKAEWEAKQAQRKLREQQELDRLAAMSDDDVMQASMNRVSQDTERLTRRNMKLCVIYRFRKILAAQGSGISQLTYKSFNGQAWGSRMCSSIQPLYSSQKLAFVRMARHSDLSTVVLNKYSTSCTGTITGAPAVSKAQSKFLQLRLAAR